MHLTAFFGKSRCVFCNTAIVKRDGAPLCSACMFAWEKEKELAHLPNSTVRRYYHLAYYDKRTPSVCRSAVLRAKEKLDGQLCRFLASELTDVLPITLQKDAIVTFVPRRREARLEIGYDQAKRLAKGVAKKAKLVFAPLLKRNVDGIAQKEQDAEERQMSAACAYMPTRKIALCKGKQIILIDDVKTTGASLGACIKLLKENGARRVDAVTIGTVRRKMRQRKDESI